MKYVVSAIALGILISAIALIYPSKQSDALRILAQDGVSQVDVSYGGFFGCGEEDIFNIAFNGMKNKVAVSGNVCSGTLKGQTIRYN